MAFVPKSAAMHQSQAQVRLTTHLKTLQRLKGTGQRQQGQMLVGRIIELFTILDQAQTPTYMASVHAAVKEI